MVAARVTKTTKLIHANTKPIRALTFQPSILLLFVLTPADGAVEMPIQDSNCGAVRVVFRPRWSRLTRWGDDVSFLRHDRWNNAHSEHSIKFSRGRRTADSRHAQRR